MGQIDLWGNEEEEARALTYEEKVNEAGNVLRLAADISTEYYNMPLIIAYSGGKDSDVMLDIALKVLRPEEIELLNSHTTVDAPETVKHIEKVFKRAREKGVKTSYNNRFPVKKTMWELIVEKRMPPTQIVRYCCEKLKEQSTKNRFTALGVRESESVKRRGRDLFK